MRRFCRHGFTLVEILIVVVVLGILAALVVPQYAKATEEASSVATRAQLEKVRQAVAVYYVRNDSRYPSVTAGDGTWGQIISPDYLRDVPTNLWVPEAASRIIILGGGPDAGYQAAHGWIFNAATGDVWAGSFDASGAPYPKP